MPLADAKTWQPGLVGRLRDRLLISARARHLAIDLVARHGDAAPDVVRDMLGTGGLTRDERLVLAKAEPTIAALVADGTDDPRRARGEDRTIARGREATDRRR